MQNRIDIIMKYEFLKFTAGRFEKKEVDNAKSFSRAGWKIPAIINLRGRVEGYVRNPPLENSSWPVSKATPPPPIPPVKSRERNPPPRLPLTLQKTNLLFPGKNDGHIVKSFYVVNFTRHRRTLYYTRLAIRNYISILSNDPILELFEQPLFFQFIMLLLKIFLSFKMKDQS